MRLDKLFPKGIAQFLAQSAPRPKTLHIPTLMHPPDIVGRPSDDRTRTAVLAEPKFGERVVARVASLRNTHNRLQPRFSCGRGVSDVVEDLLAERTVPSDFPASTVVKYKGKWYSANNRRLRCLKQARVDEIEAIVGEANAHFLRGLNTKTDGWEVNFFPPVVCPARRSEFVNRSSLPEHQCAGIV